MDLKAEANITADEYKKMQEVLKTDSPPAAKKPRSTKPKPNPSDLSPASKQRREETEAICRGRKAFKDAMSAAKRRAEGCRREIDQNVKLAQKTVTMGLPKEMSESSMAAFNPVNTSAAELLSLWSKRSMEDIMLKSEVELDNERTEIENKTVILDGGMKAVDPKIKQLKKLVPS